MVWQCRGSVVFARTIEKEKQMNSWHDIFRNHECEHCSNAAMLRDRHGYVTNPLVPCEHCNQSGLSKGMQLFVDYLQSSGFFADRPGYSTPHDWIERQSIRTMWGWIQHYAFMRGHELYVKIEKTVSTQTGTVHKLIAIFWRDIGARYNGIGARYKRKKMVTRRIDEYDGGMIWCAIQFFNHERDL